MWVALALVVSLSLVVGATAIAASSSDNSDEGLESKAAELATWPDEKKDAWNAGIEEKVAYFAEKGITVETTETASGVYGIVWTDELKAALKSLKGEDETKDGKCEVKPKAAELTTWPDEKKAAWNAGIEEKIAYLAEKGITAQTTEVAPGVRDIVWTAELRSALKDLGDGKK
jgi:hypothetical protein